MFYSDPHLAYPVRVDKPNPVFARMLQQAIGGIEGEIRVMMQYLFQAWNSRGPVKYRDMLLNTGTEEIGHIEMLATAVALNLEGAPTHMQEQAITQNPVVGAIMGGMNPRHFISSAMGALAEDSNGNPFNGSWIVSTGNIAADMYANVAAETSGRTLVTRLYEWTDDPGMKDTLSFLIARDTMHQNQWLAVLEELEQPLPVPNDFPQAQEKTEFSYSYFVQSSAPIPDHARFTEGPSVDGHGQFSKVEAKPLGQIPTLAPAPLEAHPNVQPGGKGQAVTAGTRTGGKHKKV
ncbi:catalase [Ktedonobacter sp. SOSP1-52]|uniref:manganese catalase family protein n=1 Tax=Ktedonobacter sp. SOSP1-52 TaxID=2778366 RepID=UPI001915F882|nr:manganese catalase family protein [Ktedonobacter sp. SOSP1-52]GHO70843.1 catalase [Ktedonobacter sp. SOSP1-52]